jgi:hypothetical protein
MSCNRCLPCVGLKASKELGQAPDRDRWLAVLRGCSRGDEVSIRVAIGASACSCRIVPPRSAIDHGQLQTVIVSRVSRRASCSLIGRS